MGKAEAKEEIIIVMKQGGLFMNNIIGSILRKYSAEHGFKAADKLVEEMGLEKLIGIKPFCRKASGDE